MAPVKTRRQAHVTRETGEKCEGVLRLVGGDGVAEQAANVLVLPQRGRGDAWPPASHEGLKVALDDRGPDDAQKIREDPVLMRRRTAPSGAQHVSNPSREPSPGD